MTDAGMRAEIRRMALADPDDVTSEHFPDLGTISAAFAYQWLPARVDWSHPPEYVCVPAPPSPLSSLKASNAIHWWNMAWEAGPERNELLADRLPPKLRAVRRYPNVDFRFVLLEGRSRYLLYLSLYHLLPASTLRRFGLPLLRRGIWPAVDFGRADLILPVDFEERLGRAVAYQLWPHLSSGPGRGPAVFSANEPIRLLSHTLDFWLPYLDIVIQKRMRALGPVKYEHDEQRRLIARIQRTAPPGITVSRPLFGGTVWRGETEAREATGELVEVADAHGHLRGILDAVRSNRVEEDFSGRWSWAREDFERKLYQKRARIKVSFIELRDTVPVIGPTSEVDETLMWQDLLGLLEPRERRVVVLLRSGITKAVDIARELGYANHSPVSKALARIRQKAIRYFSEN